VVCYVLQRVDLRIEARTVASETWTVRSAPSHERTPWSPESRVSALFSLQAVAFRNRELDRCFRSGAPISIEANLRAMRDEEHRRPEFLRELVIITGIDVDPAAPEDEISRQSVAAKQKLPPGGLMRAGRLCRMPAR
jgi:hypothetical protein